MKRLTFSLDRRFGFLLGTAFAILAFRSGHVGSPPVVIWTAAGLSAGFIAAAAIAPHILRPLTTAWMKLGHVIGKVVSPIVLGIIFFLIITPIATVLRLRGRDVLRLNRFNRSSYWIVRVPPGPDGGSFRQQH
jgi:hypothetical protein